LARPTSFRLPEQLLERLDEEAAARGTSVTALLTNILDEGLKTSRFPGILYREGTGGRRAGLMGGPDVWEVVRDIKHAPGQGEERVRLLADELGLSDQQIHLALDFYIAFPEEIDVMIAADRRAAERVREVIATRERLLAT